ncbi:acidocin b bacteriocin [Caudoviricetes sp.]|nr:acidocin b bacteriocin [Caudoviricetes sp.]
MSQGMNLDPSTKRFVALLFGPLFLFIANKFGVTLTDQTQQMLIELVGAYFITSKGGEVLIARAEAAGKGTGVAATPDMITQALTRALAQGGLLAAQAGVNANPTPAPTSTTPVQP